MGRLRCAGGEEERGCPTLVKETQTEGQEEINKTAEKAEGGKCCIMTHPPVSDQRCCLSLRVRAAIASSPFVFHLEKNQRRAQTRCSTRGLM